MTWVWSLARELDPMCLSQDFCVSHLKMPQQDFCVPYRKTLHATMKTQPNKYISIFFKYKKQYKNHRKYIFGFRNKTKQKYICINNTFIYMSLLCKQNILKNFVCVHVHKCFTLRLFRKQFSWSYVKYCMWYTHTHTEKSFFHSKKEFRNCLEPVFCVYWGISTSI